MKPDWCPQDVWAITGMEFDELYEQEDALEGGCEHGIRVSMAKLIMEARSQAIEECAKIAEDTFTTDSVIKNARGKPYSSGEVAIYSAKRISQAIRQHSQKGRDTE